MAHGGHGVISVTANVAPEGMVALHDAVAERRSGERAPVAGPADRACTGRCSSTRRPAPTKYALAQLGLCAEEVRLPLASCNDAVKPAIDEAMRDGGADLMAESPTKLIAENRRARFDYFLEDNIEAGIALTGHRGEGAAQRPGQHRRESYAAVEGREIVLINADIPPYAQANRFNHEPRRHRKLLLHRKQIDKLIGAVQREGRTIIPIKLYLERQGHGQAGDRPGQGQEDPRQARGRRPSATGSGTRPG